MEHPCKSFDSHIKQEITQFYYGKLINCWNSTVHNNNVSNRVNGVKMAGADLVGGRISCPLGHILAEPRPIQETSSSRAK
jgi:hypothetical protein